MSHSGSSRWREPLPSGGWDRATLALFLVAGLLVAATFRDYGSTWDERVQEEVGRDAIAWFASGGRDHLALSGGSGGDLHLYGGMFEVTAVLAARVLPFDPVETRHLLNALVALAGVAGAALLSRRLGGPRAAFFGAALLLTTPPWWGHGFANSKDIPFAAAYAWLLLALLRVADELPRPGLRRTLVAGAALGLGLAVRPGGLVLLLPLAAGVLGVRLLPVLRRSASLGRLRGVVSAGSRLIAIAGLGWAGMLALWPYGLTLPLSGPIAAVTAARSFHWNGLVRYAGGWHASTDLPRGYAPGWLLATMPETWLVIAVAGAAAGAVAWRRDRVLPALEVPWLDRGLVAAAGFGPILAAVATRPVLYDGVRHFLFVLPALAALSGWVLSAALHRLPRRGGRAVIAATAGFAALAVSDAIRLHPYQYVYFNRAVAGGLRRASFDYELDYWGATGREAIGWVARNVSPRGGRPLLVATTADPSVASHWIEGDLELRSRFVFDAPGPPDLRLATTRWFEHRATGRVLHVVKRMGVPLLYVIDPGPGAGGPLVLEGGDLAVALPPAVGWTGVAVPRPGDERAVYELRRVIGVGARAEVVVLTPRSGRVPSLEQLRAEVALAAESLGIRQGEVAPQPVVGPVARGWVVTSGDTAEEGAPSIAVAAARVGEGAILLRAQYDRDPQGSSRELVEWIRGASLAKEEERRRP